MRLSPLETLDDFIQTTLDEVERCWAVDGFAHRVDVHFSARLTRNFGYFKSVSGRITLAQRLIDHPDALREVLIHELAHKAVFDCHGPHVAHHGPEWKQLMESAGLLPRRSMPPLPGDPPLQRRDSRSYLHRCPRCDAKRIAGRPVRSWRCVACHRAGRSGDLEVVRLDS